jgi:hypothetical protein
LKQGSARLSNHFGTMYENKNNVGTVFIRDNHFGTAYRRIINLKLYAQYIHHSGRVHSENK